MAILVLSDYVPAGRPTGGVSQMFASKNIVCSV